VGVFSGVDRFVRNLHDFIIHFPELACLAGLGSMDGPFFCHSDRSLIAPKISQIVAEKFSVRLRREFHRNRLVRCGFLMR
jgi:hypothetical protein